MRRDIKTTEKNKDPSRENSNQDKHVRGKSMNLPVASYRLVLISSILYAVRPLPRV